MKLRLFKPYSAGTAAMLVAMCGYAGAQTMPQNTPQDLQKNTSLNNAQLVSATAQLTHGVNSKDAMDGQKITAKLTSDVKTTEGMKLDEGTMLIGKVEQVKKSTNDSPATLGIVFDQARLKSGRTVPVKATLLGAYPENTVDYWVDTTTSGSLLATQPHNISSDQKVDQEPGTLSHIAMHSAVQSNASGVFTSKDRNIDLKRGTRFQIAIASGVTS